MPRKRLSYGPPPGYGPGETPLLHQSRTTAWRRTKEQEDAAKLDLQRPEAKLRIELAIRAIGLGADPVRALMTEGQAVLPDGTPLPALRGHQARVYVIRARTELKAYIKTEQAELMAEALATLRQARTMAIQAKDTKNLLAVLDYQHLMLGLPNRITAARTLRMPTGPTQAGEAAELTDAELAAIIAKAKAEEAAAPTAAEAKRLIEGG